MLDVGKLIVLRAVAARGLDRRGRTRARLHALGGLAADVRARAVGRRGAAGQDQQPGRLTPSGGGSSSTPSGSWSSSEPPRRRCAQDKRSHRPAAGRRAVPRGRHRSWAARRPYTPALSPAGDQLARVHARPRRTMQRGRLDMVILSRFGAAPLSGGPGLREWVLGHDALRLCVPIGHRLADNASCSAATSATRRGSSTRRARSVGSRLACRGLGFHPVVATVDDVATALGLVGIGWGITIAPDLTPANPESAIQRISSTGSKPFGTACSSFTRVSSTPGNRGRRRRREGGERHVPIPQVTLRRRFASGSDRAAAIVA